MNKRTLIFVLVALNIGLAAGLIICVSRPATAIAQEAGGRGGVIMVAAQAELHNDAVYLVDTKNHRLHAFRTNFPRDPGTPVRLLPAGMRDLRADLQLRRAGR